MNRVSVVIPTHNRRALLAAAVDSALAQTAAPSEVIVVDDGSTDGTCAMLRDLYGARVRVERLDPRAGRSAARNLGWQRSRGDLVAFLDSDDRWLPTKLARQIPQFADPAVGLVHGHVGKIDLDGNVLTRETQAEVTQFRSAAARGYGYDGITQTWCRMYTSAVVMRREILERTGGFDPQLDEFEDWDLFWRASLQCAVATVDDVVALHRVHAGNTHTTWEAAAPAWGRISEKHLALLEDHRQAAFYRRARGNLLVNRSLAALWAHEGAASRRWMWRALRADASVLIRHPHFVIGTPLLHAFLPPVLARRLVARTGADPYHRNFTLAIDDGPSDATPALLDGLERAGHRAILFVLGCNVAGREAVLVSAIRRGFALGNHSFSHPRFSAISLDDARAEICRTEALIETLYAQAQVRRPARWFRFPYLDTGGPQREGLRSLLRELGFAGGHLDSTVVTLDWSLPAERKLRRALRRAEPGAVVEFHDKPECVHRYLDIFCDELDRLRLRAALPRPA